MARVTVEDCKEVGSKFRLVGIAARRAKDIGAGNPITVERNNDKDTVVALREIAAKHVNADFLEDEIITSLQIYANKLDVEEDFEETAAEIEENFDYIADGSAYALSEGFDAPEGDDIFPEGTEENK